MPTNQINWRQRERKIRARYRKKVWTAGIIAAIAGLIVGFVLHAVIFSAKTDSAAVMPVVQPTPEVIYITPEPVAEVTPQIIYITPEPTAVPTEAPATVVPEQLTFVQPDPTQAPVVVTPEPVVATPEPVVVTPEPVIVTPEPTQVPVAATAEPQVIAAAAVAEPAATEAPAIAPAATEAAVVPASILPAATEAPAAVVPAAVDPNAAAVAADPNAAAATEPAANPTSHEPIIVPFGQSVTFNTQIKKDGTARRDVADTEYDTVSLTMKVNAYKRPSYFEEHYYDSFSLKGDEAAVEFDITLNGYTGVTQIVPQNFILITLRGETDDVTAQGYQLMDKEISGKTGISILSDKTTTLYKRYPYSAQQGHMKYMVVTTYMDGVPQQYWFDIIDPNPVVYETLEKGIKNHTDEVKRLQGKLKRMGLLPADEKVDGKFGANTQTAVMAAQKLLGLTETGIADNEFLHKLYDD